MPWTATPDMELHYAQMIMKERRFNHVPVVRNIYERTYPVGIIDPESISLTCRFYSFFSNDLFVSLFNKLFCLPGAQIFFQIYNVYFNSYLFLILKGLIKTVQER